ncbi:hypothetical protein [Agarilytica rhodophyticola]|uniref:hypothetical protein n=1 Tax=Agarilytica rhodophyticola TaxID=1737490 RepID=UPI000B346FC4|nr:hypothetical protein [Agarilytica rhodophyticola]
MFGCPISEVGQRVPQWELPYWNEIYNQSPWDYGGLDNLFSKTAMQVCKCLVKLKSNITLESFKFGDPFNTGSLSDDEFFELDDDDKTDYLNRCALTDAQYASLNDAQKHQYEKILIANMKAVMN